MKIQPFKYGLNVKWNLLLVDSMTDATGKDECWEWNYFSIYLFNIFGFLNYKSKYDGRPYRYIKLGYLVMRYGLDGAWVEEGKLEY